MIRCALPALVALSVANFTNDLRAEDKNTASQKSAATSSADSSTTSNKTKKVNSESASSKTTFDGKPLPSKKELKKSLTSIQYAVTQQSGTERPFTNEFWQHKEEGIYVDVVSGTPLFSSKDKFDTHCGWPAFAKPISDDEIKNFADNSHGMQRIEVRSSTADSHLGHVFNDGPQELGGLRYCINSAALRFVPKEKMQEAGYGALYEKIFNTKTPETTTAASTTNDKNQPTAK